MCYTEFNRGYPETLACGFYLVQFRFYHTVFFLSLDSSIFFYNEVKMCSVVLTDTACPRGFARIKGVSCEGEYILG